MVINHVKNAIRIGYASGVSACFIQKSAPYDLLIANILARPLIGMAGSFVKIIQKNGFILLSGLLWWQRKRVAAAYVAQGMQVVSFTKCGEWCGLLLKRPE
jgi:ribosomal protein L11 methyltransferase